MSRIALLPDGLINQIAAGEVVERPASVVKELVENALDAEARTIEVELRRGGRDLVRIVDDGHGMDRDDATRCLQRHATSKIRTLDDLVAVETLGFRGEAVPSVASISKFELRTRRREDPAGTRVVVEGGELRTVEDVGCAAGTEIDVREIFYNQPVRRGFLRTAGTELGHCLEAVTREALAHPGVDFTVRHGGRVVLRAPAVADRAARVRDLLGDHAKNLVPVSFEDDGFLVSGLVSPPHVTRASRTGATYLYVNGRFVRDPVLRRAVSEAYEGLVPRGRYPIVVLEVRLAPEAVDVNAHPAKIEVRFRDPRALVTAVSTGVRAALQGLHPEAPPLPSPDLPLSPVSPAWAPMPAPRPEVSAHPEDDPRFASEPWEPPPRYERVEAPPEAPRNEEYLRQPVQPARRYRELRPIGLLAQRFVLCEDASGLVVIDHIEATAALAVHALQVSVAAGEAVRLEPAVAVEVVLDAHLQLALEMAGIRAEAVGPGTLAVTSVPPALLDADVEAAIRDLAEDPTLETLAAHVQTLEPEDDLLALRTLLASLDEADASGLIIRIASAEIALRFRRRG